MKGKQITLYHIYNTKQNSKGQTVKIKTQISFTTDEEAKRYCNYLNKNHQDTGDNFSYKEERSLVFKKAMQLIMDENELQILYSNDPDVEFIPLTSSIEIR